MSGVYRDDNCLEHMIEACRKIRRIAAVSRADYDSSEEKQLALERFLRLSVRPRPRYLMISRKRIRISRGDRRLPCGILSFTIMPA